MQIRHGEQLRAAPEQSAGGFRVIGDGLLTARIQLSAIVPIPQDAPALSQQAKDAAIADFLTAVTDYRAALVAHLGTVGKPAPRATEQIEAAIRRVPMSIDKPDTFVIDYEIIDDHPIPEAVRKLRESINGT